MAGGRQRLPAGKGGRGWCRVITCRLADVVTRFLGLGNVLEKRVPVYRNMVLRLTDFVMYPTCSGGSIYELLVEERDGPGGIEPQL